MWKNEYMRRNSGEGCVVRMLCFRSRNKCLIQWSDSWVFCFAMNYYQRSLHLTQLVVLMSKAVILPSPLEFILLEVSQHQVKVQQVYLVAQATSFRSAAPFIRWVGVLFTNRAYKDTHSIYNFVFICPVCEQNSHSPDEGAVLRKPVACATK